MSKGWRDAILNDFSPGEHPLTLVADPDNLFADEVLLAELQTRGVVIEVYEDPIAFRFLYESMYRPPLAAENVADLIVLLRQDREALDDLPYDLIQRGRRLDFGLAALFPHLSRNVVASLDNRELDALYEAQLAMKPHHLGENATKDFVLRHVYQISVDSLKSDAEILGKLLQLYVSGHQLPPLLAEHLVTQINNATGFADWPLYELLTDYSTLLAFLQERWPIFLDQLAAETKGETGDAAVREAIATNQYMLNWPGQASLPFKDPHIRAYVDTLFLERKLRPVEHPHAAQLQKQWVVVGLQEESDEDRRRKLERLIKALDKKIPTAEAPYQQWIEFASNWAELVLLCHQQRDNREKIEPSFNPLQARVDTSFQDWLSRRYHNLATLPPHPPVMVHHIARSLARDIRPDNKEKIALIVIDGLALDQWLIIRNTLHEVMRDLRFSESAVFAWLPTITAISRQAIFAGKVPSGFADTIATTSAESDRWTAFWEGEGIDRRGAGYEKGLREIQDLGRVEALISQARLRVVGLVVNQIDEMMHGEKLGKGGLHSSIQRWLSEGFITRLLGLLIDYGYQIVVTSDHGNIEARGIGSPQERSLADSRGARARIYPNEILRAQVHKDVPNAICWATTGLPSGFWPLLASNRDAFAPNGTRLVTHGGMALEEMVVPYIRIYQARSS